MVLWGLSPRLRWKWYSARVGVEALFRLQEQVREGTVQVVAGVAVEEVAQRGLPFRDHDRHALVRDVVPSVEPDFSELVRVFRDPSEVPVQAAFARHARFRRNLDIFRGFFGDRPYGGSCDLCGKSPATFTLKVTLPFRLPLF